MNLNPTNIAVCGLGLTGKTSILTQLRLRWRAWNAELFAESIGQDRILGLQASHPLGRIEMTAAIQGSGAMRPKACYVRAMRDCHAGIFVVSACLHGNSLEFVHSYTERCEEVAREFQRSWDDVPWLLVCTKTDVPGGTLSVLDYFPKRLRVATTFVNPWNGMGIDLISNWIEMQHQLHSQVDTQFMVSSTPHYPMPTPMPLKILQPSNAPAKREL